MTSVQVGFGRNPVKQRRQDMPMIYVKTKPGRKAFYEGRIIPEDKFIPVADTPYIRRLVHVWEDVELDESRLPQPKQSATTT